MLWLKRLPGDLEFVLPVVKANKLSIGRLDQVVKGELLLAGDTGVGKTRDLCVTPK